MSACLSVLDYNVSLQTEINRFQRQQRESNRFIILSNEAVFLLFGLWIFTIIITEVRENENIPMDVPYRQEKLTALTPYAKYLKNWNKSLKEKQEQ